MFEHVWVPIIVLPFALLLINRFTYLFDLEWDKFTITKFDKVKYRIVDSLLLSLLFFVAIGITVVKTENIDLLKLFKSDPKNSIIYATLIASLIYVSICNYAMLRIYSIFIKSKNNIKILLPNNEGIEEEYNFIKGIDGSFHLFKDTYGVNKTIIKQGKALIEESTIKYKIASSRSKIDLLILNRLTGIKNNLNYEINSVRKKITHSAISIIFFVIMLFSVDDSWETIFNFWFIWIIWLFLIYLTVELLSVFFIPIMVNKFNEYTLHFLYGIRIESKKEVKQRDPGAVL